MAEFWSLDNVNGEVKNVTVSLSADGDPFVAPT